MNCIIKNDEYNSRLAIAKAAGVKELDFEALSRHTLEKYGRYPYLDEFPEVDSTPVIEELLKLRNQSGFKLSNNSVMQERLGTVDPEEATIKLCKQFPDKLIIVLALSDDTSFIEIRNRPNMTHRENDLESEEIKSNSSIILGMLNLMIKFDGLQVHAITDNDIHNSELEQLDNVYAAKAFVYNGEIFVNIDKATASSPIHEMLHVLVGGVKYLDRALYLKLVEKTAQNIDLKKALDAYPSKALNDILEEHLINEYAKFLKGEESGIQDWEPSDVKELNYFIKRALDTALFGEYTVNIIPDSELFKQSYLDLGKLLRSKNVFNQFCNTIDKSRTHRILANMKEDLMKKGTLEQVCN